MNAASVLCGGEKINDEQSAKIKRDASVGSYSYTATDISKYDGSHVKTVTVLKNIDKPVGVDAYSFSRFNAPRKTPKVKTTVEFWPPDMDKEKFYSMKKDSEMTMWTVKQEAPVKVMQPVKLLQHEIYQKPLPEKLADIPTDVHSWSLNDFNDYQPLIGPTESSIIDNVSITNPGPVVFPTLEPTTKGPGTHVVYISNTGHKKRKLKKKVKAPTVPFVETSPTIAPDTNSVSDFTSRNENIADATPIYENIDEPYVDIFKPVRYTDVISNVSDLTESTFGNRVNVSSDKIKIIENSKPVENNPIVAFSVSDSTTVIDSNQVMETTSSGFSVSNGTPVDSTSLTINDLTPLEKLFKQLKQAIEDRDITRIKKIVQLMEEPVKEVIKTPSTTVTAATDSSSPSSTLLPVEASSTVKSKIYLAPRIRNAQKKVKQLITTPADEKLNDNIVTEAETMAFISTTLESTTEKMETKASSVPSSRKNRRGRATQTPRVNKASKRSRQVAKRSSRRIIRKTS